MTLAEKLLALASALTTAQVPHAYGGAIALAYALEEAPKDWLDLRLMWESGTLDVAVVTQRLSALVGDDPRIGRLQRIPRD